jgi:rare lipoprotein A
MANGRVYDMERFTVAHRTLPLGTEVCITNRKTGKSVRAVVTDRGPYVAPRIIDLSKRVADELGITESGLEMVTISIRPNRLQ